MCIVEYWNREFVPDAKHEIGYDETQRIQDEGIE